jgi:hypothetical protein
MRFIVALSALLFTACSPATTATPNPAHVGQPVHVERPASQDAAPPYQPGPGTVPNAIPDTPENRQVLDVCERYRTAMEDQNATALLALASPRYLDDGGTPQQADDDVDHIALASMLDRTLGQITDVTYTFEYDRIDVHGDHAEVDYRYLGSYRHGGIERRVADANRLTLRREAGEWKIVSGM